MYRLLFAFVSAVALLSALGSVAAAAPKPDNPSGKVDVLPVSCDELGDLEVVTLQNESVVAWADSQVFVAKRFGGEFNATITTFDGNTYSFTDSFVDELSKGQGFQDRLVQCTFSETETETFTLDAGFADHVGIPESYVDTEVTLEGTFDGTAWVMPTGK